MAIAKRIKDPTKFKPVDLITYYQIVSGKEVTETDKLILVRTLPYYRGEKIYDLLWFLRTCVDNNLTLYPLMVGDTIPTSYLNKYRYWSCVNEDVKKLMDKLDDIMVSWIGHNNANTIIQEMDEVIAKL